MLQDIQPSTIADSIDASMIAYQSFLSTSEGGKLHKEPGILWAESAYLNGVFHTDLTPAALPQTIERMCDYFAGRGQDCEWRVGPSSRPAGLGEALLTHGFSHVEDEPGMALNLADLNENISIDPDLVIQPVTNDEQVEQWVRTWLFPVPEEIVRKYIAAYLSLQLGSQSPLRLYLGLLDGRPVATVSVFYDGNVAGIHYVVTLPEVRRRGIGGAMTLMAARQAREQGYHIAVLTASPYGINIYRRLGFREYGTFSTYAASVG